MINFKFYVQTPFFSTFITLHLGKGHIQTVNRHSGPGGATASLFSGVDSYVWCKNNFGGKVVLLKGFHGTPRYALTEMRGTLCSKVLMFSRLTKMGSLGQWDIPFG